MKFSLFRGSCRWLSAMAGALTLAAGPAAQAQHDHSHEVIGIPNSNGTTREIRLKARSFVPDAGITEAQQSAAGVKKLGRSWRGLVQFENGPTQAQADALKAQGVQVLYYIPNSALGVSVPSGFNLSKIPGLRWAGELQTSDKLAKHIGVTSGIAVEFWPDVTAAEKANTLRTAGLSAVNVAGLPGNVSIIKGGSAEAATLAASNNVAYVMAAPDSAVNGQKVTYYCPGPMTSLGRAGNFVIGTEGWDGPGQGSANLTYWFGKLTTDVPATALRRELVKGITTWSKYAEINFSETQQPNLDKSVDIFFAEGEHGDGLINAFDGKNGVLAHCYYPPTNAPAPQTETIFGDMHYDDAETWSVDGAGDTIQLAFVGIHEMGHGLGLDHSDDPAAVMYPFYHLIFDLHPDDIAGIQAIYKAKTATPTPTSPANPTLDIADASAIEGNGGVTSSLAYTVTLSKAATSDVVVNIETADGSAQGSSDYRVVNRSLTFTPGQTSRTLNVAITGDDVYEGNEYFFIRLTSAAGALLGRAEARATIRDDDAPPPTIGKIAFIRTDNGVSDVFTMNGDGTAQRNVSKDKFVDSNPVLSATGARIAYISNRSGSPQLWVMNVDGSNRRQLTFLANREVQNPIWRADGKQIAFNVYRVNNGTPVYNVAVVDIDGKNLKNLTTDGKSLFPAYSPDGTRIAYVADFDGGKGKLYVMSAAGVFQKIVINTRIVRHPRWGTNNKIVYSRFWTEGNFDIATVEPDSGTLAILSADADDEAWPTWSPDNSYVAWQRTSAGTSTTGTKNVQIWRMAFDGSETIKLTEAGANRMPHWSLRTRRAPIAESATYTIRQGDPPFEGELKASDPDGDPLSFALVAAPENGALILNPNGTFLYEPFSDFLGTDSFTYEVTDGEFKARATITFKVGAPTISKPVTKSGKTF